MRQICTAQDLLYQFMALWERKGVGAFWRSRSLRPYLHPKYEISALYETHQDTFRINYSMTALDCMISSCTPSVPLMLDQISAWLNHVMSTFTVQAYYLFWRWLSKWNRREPGKGTFMYRMSECVCLWIKVIHTWISRKNCVFKKIIIITMIFSENVHLYLLSDHSLLLGINGKLL